MPNSPESALNPVHLDPGDGITPRTDSFIRRAAAEAASHAPGSPVTIDNQTEGGFGGLTGRAKWAGSITAISMVFLGTYLLFSFFLSRLKENDIEQREDRRANAQRLDRLIDITERKHDRDAEKWEVQQERWRAERAADRADQMAITATRLKHADEAVKAIKAVEVAVEANTEVVREAMKTFKTNGAKTKTP